MNITTIISTKSRTIQRTYMLLISLCSTVHVSRVKSCISLEFPCRTLQTFTTAYSDSSILRTLPKGVSPAVLSLSGDCAHSAQGVSHVDVSVR